MAGLLAAPAVGARRAARAPAARCCAGGCSLACAARARARHHAVRHAADPRRALPGAQRRRADGVPRRSSSVELHVQQGRRTTRSCTTSIASSTASPSCRERQAPFSAQVGMWWLYFKWQWLRDAHGEQPALQSAARRALPRARPRSAATCTGSATGEVLVLRAADVHDDARAHLLPELQVRRVAGARARGRARARCATATTSTSGASPPGACGRRSASSTCGSRSRAHRRERVTLGRETVELPTRRALALASPLLALACIPLVRQLAHGVARRRDRHARLRRATCSTPSSRTACSSPSATTTPSRSGTRRKWKACGRTSSSRTRRCSTPTGIARELIRRPVYEYDAAKGPAVYRGTQLAEADEARVLESQHRAARRGAGVRGAARAADLRAGRHSRRRRSTPARVRRAAALGPARAADAQGQPRRAARSTSRARRRSTRRRSGSSRTRSRRGSRRRSRRRPLAAGRDTVAVPGLGFIDVPRTTALWTRLSARPPRSSVAATGWTGRRRESRRCTRRPRSCSRRRGAAGSSGRSGEAPHAGTSTSPRRRTSRSGSSGAAHRVRRHPRPGATRRAERPLPRQAVAPAEAAGDSDSDRGGRKHKTPRARGWPRGTRGLAMVGATGFEPATSCSRSRRATGLRYAPPNSSASEAIARCARRDSNPQPSDP